MMKADAAPIDDFFVHNGSEGDLVSLVDSYSLYLKKLNEGSNKKYFKDEHSRLKLFKEVHSQKESGTLFRKNDEANASITLSWLAEVKMLSKYFAEINNVPVFNGITKPYLGEIAKLSVTSDNLNKLERILAHKGIILVTDRAISGSKLDGAVFKLETGQAVVALSLRYSRLDYFWFTLLHELSHLCLHFDQLKHPIIEELDDISSKMELEADKLALNSFVPRNVWRSNPVKYSPSKESIESFAQKLSIHPSIVAGRLRKELNRYDLFSSIVNEIDVREYFY